MELLPDHSRDHSNSKARNTGEYSHRSDDSEEVPEPARKLAAVELLGEKAPREWRGADEA